MYSLKNFKINYPLLAILVFFGAIYCSISLINHYNFRTYGWDLGLFNNAIYDYSHFHWNDVSLLLPNLKITNTLGDHFSLLPMLISPFYWIFGTYTMLVFQILGILWGGYGIYCLIYKYSNNKIIALAAISHFFLMWGVYSALSFDYHDNVMAAMFVPWFIYFIQQKKYRNASIYFILILISKENMAFWMFFICIGLLLLNTKDSRQLKTLSIFSGIAIIYFVFVIKVAIPHIFGANEGYIHFHYSALGNSFGDAVKTVLTRPFYVIKLLFINHLNYKVANGIKLELHYVVLLSGGIVLLFKPQYLIMLIPIYAQKLYSDDFGKWGINVQYSIEFAPILTIAVFSWISNIKKKFRPYIIPLFVMSCGIISLIKLENRTSKWYKAENNQFYTKSHFQRDFNVNKIHKALRMIPKNSIVSAQSMLIPHLSFRETIYNYPYISNAEYIVLLPSDKSTYPISVEEYEKKLSDLEDNSIWDGQKIDGLIIFKRR